MFKNDKVLHFCVGAVIAALTLWLSVWVSWAIVIGVVVWNARDSRVIDLWGLITLLTGWGIVTVMVML